MKRARSVGVAVIASLVAMTVSPTLRADEARDEAMRRMVEAQTLANQGQYELARAKYAEACALVHSIKCIQGLGATEFFTSHYVEAFDHIDETLESPASELDPATRRRLEDMRQKAYAASGHLMIKAPEHATLFVDDRAVGTAPSARAFTVAPGPHVVRANEAHAQATVAAGQVTTIDLNPPTAPPRTEPAPSPSVPIVATPRPVGPGEGAETGGAGTELPAVFWTPRRTWGAVIAAGGVLLLGVGGAFALKVNGDADDAASAHQTAPSSSGACAKVPAASCRALEDAYSTQATDHALNLTFLIAGGAAAVAGAALFLWPVSGEHARAAIAPIVTDHGVSLQVRGEL